MNRYLGALFLGVCLSSTALVGCGDDSTEDDDGGSAKPAEVNETQAASTVAASTRAISSLDAGDGYNAAGSLFAAAGSAFLIIDYSGSQQQAAPPAGDLAIAASALCEESCVVEGEGGRCDFTGCDTGSYQIDGFIEWGAGNFKTDITFGISGDSGGQAVSFDYHLVSDINYTATSIDGTLSMDGTTTSGQTEVTFEADITYNDVQFPENGGCPTSGSVDVSASVETGGQGYEASGSITFPVATCTG